MASGEPLGHDEKSLSDSIKVVEAMQAASRRMLALSDRFQKEPHNRAAIVKEMDELLVQTAHYLKMIGDASRGASKH